MNVDYVYANGDIIVEPYQFEKILKMKLTREINEHARFSIEGIISEELNDKYIEQTGNSSFMRISIRDNENNVTEIFTGTIDTISIATESNVKTLQVTAISNTYLMDIEKKSKSYQGSLAYRSILERTNQPYGNVQMIDYTTAGKQTDRVVVQYNETDWEFIKRMASCCSSVIIGECTTNGIKYSVGKGSAGVTYCLENQDYTVRKGISRYKKKAAGCAGIPLKDTDFITYEFTSNRIFNLMDSIAFKGKENYLLVYKCEIELVGGVLQNKYYLCDELGMTVEKQLNENIKGASLDGKVLAVSLDKVKVSLAIDGYSKTAELSTWFPYSTVFSSPDGTGWYCMPEIGDAVRLYFPDGIESNAYVINSVDLKSSNSAKRVDPSVKSIGTKYGKEIILSPGAINVISSGSSMTLSDSGGISINSGSSISMSGSSVSISGGSVSICGSNGVTLSQSGARISINNDITMSGVKINTQ